VTEATAVRAEPAPAPPPHPRTIGALWRRAVAAHRLGPAYLVERGGRWNEVSWRDAARRVDEYANGLLALGVRKGDSFGILARTTLEWALFDFALALVGGIAAPVYASSSADDCAYALRHADAIGVLVEDETRLAKIEETRNDLPTLEHVLTFADLDVLAARGRAFASENPTALADAEAAIVEDDLYTYIYTSGTTGPPKACMIRHRNYYAMAAIVDRLEDFLVAGDTMLLYLPLAHNFGRLMNLAGAYAGFTVAFCPDPYAVAPALEQVRPTVFPSVPRLYEKMHTAVRSKLEESGGARGRLAAWALDVARRAAPLRKEGRSLPPGLALQHRIADRLVLAKVRRRLGGRLRLAICGGAPLAAEIAEFFYALGILVLEGYGLSECTTAATVNRPDRFKFGTVGPALPGVELRLAEDGELLIRSETLFAGYLNDEAATAEVLLADGWLASGDVAEIDEDGFVRITDRKKDILVTAGGENVAPQNLENELKASRCVSQALVVGDRRPYVVALVTLDEDEVAKWRAAGGEDVESLVQELVDRVNARHSRFEQIKRFAIVPREFSQEEGEVTPTLKVRRRVCERHFAAEIERLYAGV
jgi:long-chain acyl-CoA synthetase